MPLTNKLEGYCPKDSNHKRVSVQPQATGASEQPQARSSFTCLPRYKRQAALVFTSIKVFSGWRTWNDIWWGDRRTLLVLVTFNSTVKKCWLLLYPNRSGQPSMLVFSSLVHVICGVILLSSCQNLVSGLGIFRRNYFGVALILKWINRNASTPLSTLNSWGK